MSQLSDFSQPSLPLSPATRDQLFDDIGDLNLMNGQFDFHSFPDGYEDEPTLPQPDVKPVPLYEICKEEYPCMFPPPLTVILANDEYSGEFDFDVTMPNHTSKNPWVYSQSLNKVFMLMGQPFPVQFRTSHHNSLPLFVRVTPQYSQQHQSTDPVVRCINHGDVTDPSNKGVDEFVRQHVIRCKNSLAKYLGRKENHRLSVVFPLGEPQAGTNCVCEMFYFVCMSTCASPGINRRNLELIYTLENDSGYVLGRKCLKVRVCACPKRDKEKEEESFRKKQNGPTQRGKKRKLVPTTTDVNPSDTTNDTKEYTLNLKIMGMKNVQSLLAHAESLMGYEVLKHQGQPLEGPYKKNLEGIQTIARSLNQP